ncbi:MAG: hypothetical protein ACOVOQ_09135 [Flavobacterium sp.]|jgi:hypothetical protein
MLPKVDVPIYDLKLLSVDKKIRFRPFTVKEEKLFLMASESQDAESVLNTIKQVVNNCILSDINVDSLPVFDLEYLFLNLRARSISELVTLKYKCNNTVEEDKKCGNIVQFDLNLLDIKPTKENDHTNKIEINDKLGIVMKYPSFEMIEKYKDAKDASVIVNLIIDCIDYIYDAENMYYAKDTLRQELEEFIDSLQSKELEKLKLFFESMPKIKKKLQFKCNKCNHEEDIDVEGIQSFFG